MSSAAGAGCKHRQWVVSCLCPSRVVVVVVVVVVVIVVVVADVVVVAVIFVYLACRPYGDLVTSLSCLLML